VFAFANMVYLFANELAGLRRRRFAFAFVPTGSLERFFLWHLLLPPNERHTDRLDDRA
jgi:hypothetical protein